MIENKDDIKKVKRIILYISIFILILTSLLLYKSNMNSLGTDAIDTSEGDIKNIESGIILLSDSDLSGSNTFEREYLINATATNIVDETGNIVTEQFYTVKRGDTLLKISKMTGQDINVIVANNPKIKNGIIRIGEKIKILSANGIYYKVRKGDSLVKISNKYKVKIAQILDDNSLNDTRILAGERLFIKNPDLTYLASSLSPGSNRRKRKKSKNSMFSWPIQWRGVTSRFGSRFHPVLKRYIYHAGVDLRARIGTTLKAPANGKVTYSGWMRGYGKLIKIQHSSGYSTRYAHLNKIYVKKGQYVKKGKTIGTTGKTGRVTGPHLHYEIRKNGTPLNPLKFK